MWEIRIIECISCGYFLWDSATMVIWWHFQGTDYFQVEGLIHGVMCSIVYIASMVRTPSSVGSSLILSPETLWDVSDWPSLAI